MFFIKSPKRPERRVIPRKNDVYLLTFNIICPTEIINNNGKKNVSPGRGARGMKEIFD